MLERLKPCPFCGKSAVAFCLDDHPVLQKLGVEKGQRVWYVGCRSSDCILYADKNQKTAQLFFWDGNINILIAKWNRRAAAVWQEADPEDLISRKETVEAIEAEKIAHGEYTTSSYVGYEFAEEVVERMPPARPWISVYDRLPEEEGLYLVAGDFPPGAEVHRRYFNILHDRSVWSGTMTEKVKWWMPIPKHPEMEQDETQ